MKIANIDRESGQIFWTTWQIWMKFLGEMRFIMMVLALSLGE